MIPPLEQDPQMRVVMFNKKMLIGRHALVAWQNSTLLCINNPIDIGSATKGVVIRLQIDEVINAARSAV